MDAARIIKNPHLFYVSREWKRIRRQVLAMDHNGCVECKRVGRYRKATHVHHVNHLDRRPEMATEIFYRDAAGVIRRNLISVCRECHETVCHPERMRVIAPKKYVTIEKW